MIRGGVKPRTRPLERVTVVDLKQPKEYFERFSRVFGCEVEPFNEGFVSFASEERIA